MGPKGRAQARRREFRKTYAYNEQGTFRRKDPALAQLRRSFKSACLLVELCRDRHMVLAVAEEEDEEVTVEALEEEEYPLLER